jgi:hypothetical protein
LLPPRCCRAAVAAAVLLPLQCRAATAAATALLPSCRCCRRYLHFHLSLLLSLQFSLLLPPPLLVVC